MPKSMADYRAELVEILLNDEDLNLTEQSARADVSRFEDYTIFDLLNIEPDEEAIAEAEAAQKAALEEQERIQSINEHHNRLSKLKGAERMAAIMDLEQNGGTGNVLPTSERVRLQSGELKGRDRIAAALNQHNA